MVQVLYRRIKVKKVPKKKRFNLKEATFAPDLDLYYMLNKKLNFGELELSGDSVFNKGEILEVEFQVANFNTRLRMLAKIDKISTFSELKRVLWRGKVQFSAVSKEDYDRLLDLDAKRIQEESQFRERIKTPSNPPAQGSGPTLKIRIKPE